MNPETPATTAPEAIPTPPWYRARRSGRFSAQTQRVSASPTFWQNLPRKSILNLPGNQYQPRPLGDKFKKGPLRAAQVVQKFFDRASGKGFARLSTGTVIKTNETRDTVLGQAAQAAV